MHARYIYFWYVIPLAPQHISTMQSLDVRIILLDKIMSKLYMHYAVEL